MCFFVCLDSFSQLLSRPQKTRNGRIATAHSTRLYVKHYENETLFLHHPINNPPLLDNVNPIPKAQALNIFRLGYEDAAEVVDLRKAVRRGGLRET